MSEWLNKTKGWVAKILASLLPNAVVEQIICNQKKREDFSQIYFSQEGEEIILRRYFKNSNTGFFVDVGAHHPLRFSNTYLLYKLGWCGINIDATPGSMVLFNQQRQLDINIEAALSDKEETLTFIRFDEPALNTFDNEKAKHITTNSSYKVVTKEEIKTTTLQKILAHHLPPNTEINFFTIDAEGFDLQILKGNNWELYKPEVILVETDCLNISDLKNDTTYIYLIELGYTLFAKTFKTVFYCRKT